MKVFALFFLLTITVFTQSFLYTSGKKIFEPNGEEILLQGINLGGWLVPEGYMLHSSGTANSPSEIRNAIIDLMGEDFTDEFFQKYRENYVSKEDIDKLAELGFNSIRLPFHYSLLSPRDEPGVYLEEGFALIDSAISWCRANDLYIILDMHCAPGGQSAEPISDYDPNYPSLWEDENNRTRTASIWRKIAERYKDNTTVAGYDLLNEPAWDLGDGTLLRETYIMITDSVRSVDTNHIIIIEGNWFATVFDKLTPPWDSKLIYQFHKYWNDVTQGTIQYIVNISNDYNVPLWLGEFGENSNDWITKAIKLAENNNIGWAIWPHKKVKSIAVLNSANLNINYQQIVNYWNGSGSKPSSLFSYTAFMMLAEDLKLSNTDFKEGYYDALFRRVQETTIIPYKDHFIPGRIFAVDYDMGNQGYAYSDEVFQNINGSNWNNGWSYRNDGVDIEECSDVISNGFNVGFISNGEWLKYSVNVLEAGIYKAEIRYASQATSNGLMIMALDGKILASGISIPSTGGWQNWQTKTVDNIVIEAGSKELMLQFPLGNFNLNYVNFVKTGTTGIETENPQKFGIDYYPNPFNSTINITIQNPEKSTLKIFDITGSLVKNYFLKSSPEIVNIQWHGKNNEDVECNSGVYFLTYQSDERIVTKKLVMLK